MISLNLRSYAKRKSSFSVNFESFFESLTMIQTAINLLFLLTLMLPVIKGDSCPVEGKLLHVYRFIQ